jgi:site-specific DNA-cytosine methylase
MIWSRQVIEFIHWLKPRQLDSKPDPHDFVNCSEQYGISQERHRVIVLGVRNDIIKEPKILKSKERVAFEAVFHGD